MTQRFMALSETAGAYLGECMGLGFWTKIDHVDQSEAWTWESKEEAEGFNADHGIEGSRIVPVEVASPPYATIDECVAAGAERWEPKE
jgi:hypothetical protein